MFQGCSTHNCLYGHGCIGFSANHTSILKPHPCKLRVRDYVEATRVRFMAKNAPKFLISLTNQLSSISREIFWENWQVINRSFQSVWFRQWLWLYYLRPDLAYTALFSWKLWKLGVSMGVAFWPFRLKFPSYSPVFTSIHEVWQRYNCITSMHESHH